MRLPLLICALLGLAASLLPRDAWEPPVAASRPDGGPSQARPEGFLARTHAPLLDGAPAHESPTGLPRVAEGAGEAPRAGHALPASESGDAGSVAAESTPQERGREARAGPVPDEEAIASILSADDPADTIGPLVRLYFAYFNRFPDWEGLQYYIAERARSTPMDSIAEEFAGSREFGIRYGHLDNAAFLDRVFENVLAGPDSAQRTFWLAQLDSGAMTRGQVMLAFSESIDFRTVRSNAVFIAIAYAEALGRAPEPAEFRRWVRFLDSGNPRSAVIDGLLATSRRR